MLTRIRRLCDGKTIGSYFATGSDAWGTHHGNRRPGMAVLARRIDQSEREDGTEEVLVRDKPVAFLDVELAGTK